MDKKTKISKYTNAYAKEVFNLISSLNPSWFDDTSLKNIPRDIQIQRCFIAHIEEEVLGFISIYSVEGIGQIGWFGIHPDHHREGIGKKLLHTVERQFLEANISVIQVETITEQIPADGTYDETIKFYTKMGYKLYKKGKQEESDGYKFRKSMLRKVL